MTKLDSASHIKALPSLGAETLAGAPTGAPAFSCHHGMPRVLTHEQVQFARLCVQVRQKYPSLTDLARKWGVARCILERAAHGMTYKDVPWREGIL